jgi:hypothetical protein
VLIALLAVLGVDLSVIVAVMVVVLPQPRSPPKDVAEPPGRRCAPSPGTSPRAAARAWPMPCWTFPKCRKAHT